MPATLFFAVLLVAILLFVVTIAFLGALVLPRHRVESPEAYLFVLSLGLSVLPALILTSWLHVREDPMSQNEMFQVVIPALVSLFSMVGILQIGKSNRASFVLMGCYFLSILLLVLSTTTIG